MTRAHRKAADRLLSYLAMPAQLGRAGGPDLARLDPQATADLAAAGLVMRGCEGDLALTELGRARLARLTTKPVGDIDPFRSQHLALARRPRKQGETAVIVNDAESPLAWLARRKGRDGRPMIEPAQFQAGERLRSDFTFAQLSPRMTVDWASPIGGSANPVAGGPAAMTDAAVAARQRLRHALDAVGPEFAGLLVDVCCFLKGIEDMSASADGRRDRPRWFCSSASTGWQGIMD